MTEHIDPSLALALAALSEDDPERRKAWDHAAQCVACRALLDEGAAMLRVIDAEQDLPQVSTALKARIKAARTAAPRPRLVWAPLALVACALASLSLAFLDGRGEGPISVGVGLHCLFLEIALAMVPIASAAVLARGGITTLAPLPLAALAGGFALVEQVLLRSRCPVQDALAHQLAFHVTGVLLAAVLGMSAARRLPKVR